MSNVIHRYQVYDAIVRDSRLTDLDRRVAWRIMDRMGPKGISWPGVRLLASELNVTERAVRNSTRRLDVFGYIEKEMHAGRGKSNLYRLKTENARKHPGTLKNDNEKREQSSHKSLLKRSSESTQESSQESPQCKRNDSSTHSMPRNHDRHDGLQGDRKAAALRRLYERFGGFERAMPILLNLPVEVTEAMRQDEEAGKMNDERAWRLVRRYRNRQNLNHHSR